MPRNHSIFSFRRNTNDSLKKLIFNIIIGYLFQKNYSIKDDKGGWSFFQIYYKVLLGDFEDFFKINADYDNLLWMYFIVFTLFMNIVLLNLLIAIISDSYDKMIAVNRISKNYELLCFKVKNEKLSKSIFWRWWLPKKLNQDFLNYFHVIRPRKELEIQIKVEERIRGKIENIEKTVWKLDSKFETILNKVEERIRGKIENIEKTVWKLDSKFETILKTINDILDNIKAKS